MSTYSHLHAHSLVMSREKKYIEENKKRKERIPLFSQIRSTTPHTNPVAN
jgi:hypothetical protein